MANPANMMKMLNALGGMASESYGSPTQGGQPILPKPQISGPGVMSPYAPMNDPVTQSMTQSNSGTHQKPTQMGNSDAHPANQLAQYLMMAGKSARTPLSNPGDHARGAMTSMSGVIAGSRQ